VLLYENKKAVPRNARYYDSDTGRFIMHFACLPSMAAKCFATSCLLPDPTVPDPSNTQTSKVTLITNKVITWAYMIQHHNPREILEQFSRLSPQERRFMVSTVDVFTNIVQILKLHFM
jgi:hypothetical protein